MSSSYMTENFISGDSNPTGSIAVGVAIGAALLFAAPAIGFAWLHRRKPQDHFFEVPVEEDPEVQLGQLKRFSLRSRNRLLQQQEYSRQGWIW
ncbi:unnamed protein product [Rhodiola kirilowii]